MSERDLALIDQALCDLEVLAVLYERRLFFRGRYRREALRAAASLRAARRVLRADRGE